MVKVRDRINFSTARALFASTSIFIFLSSTDSFAACSANVCLRGVTVVLINFKMPFYCLATVAYSSDSLIRLWILALATESHSLSEPSTKPFFEAGPLPSLIFYNISTRLKSLN